ncbi:TetR/AcrR family transcriptional regulator [Yinghuangia seranimata]|uniref:TetR/AcrR family transcriptional regulator n=1 Tax=Yinghuangia seranimata TaxID=408067 RepID=UPI00248C1742|nr:TetR/AcrR family transcriptional regulator [Yinghuangia seranimata]MDI2124544.1 TetR/AcrR family transcriptional regulator [Yinghuangia seranimata]
MQEHSHLAGTRRPGGRTARTQAAVYDALMAELAESGYGGTSVEKIAARASVAPSTVYRRWGNLEGIVLSLVGDMTRDVDVPDTGDLEADLLALARVIVGLLGHPVQGTLLDSIVAAATRDQAARDTLRAEMLGRVKRTSVIVEHAVQRGEVPEDTDTWEVIRLMAAPLYYRAYITREPLADADAQQAATVAAFAAKAGIVRKRPDPS